MNPKRLNKLISDSGFCSRREADKLIEQGRVTVNGRTPQAGTQVTAKDKVRIDGELLHVREEEPVFLIFNKPAGISTATDTKIKNNITSALNYPASLLPVGFLDREAEGLLFLSNDTELVRKLNRADNKYEKEYLVTVDKMLTPEFLAKISESGTTPGEKNHVVREAPNRFRIVLAPGTNHHLKKMCEDLGYKAVHLQRIRLAGFTTTKLPVRTWRVLTDTELAELKSILGTRARKDSTPRHQDEDFYDELIPARPVARARSGGRKPNQAANTGRRGPQSRAAATAAPGAPVDKSTPKSRLNPVKGRKTNTPGGRRGRASGGNSRKAR